jgi:hypothetical protein
LNARTTQGYLCGSAALRETLCLISTRTTGV